MKKYRLIGWDIHYKVDVPIETKYNFLDDAASALLVLQAKNPNAYYRIEEVEESITDRVKSYEDACKVIGKEPYAGLYSLLNNYNNRREVPHIIVLLKLETITAALNEGWKPEWKAGDWEDKKWCVVWCSHTNELWVVFDTILRQYSPRLYFKSHELAEYAAKQFAELYKQLLVDKF